MTVESREKYIVTSALPYVNGVKHLGNFVGSLLPADIYARYLRLQGHDVLAICGTDEHGTPCEVAALEEGLPVEEYAKKYYKIQKKIYEDFYLSFDYFGRTSSPENHAMTQQLFLKLYENGLIKEQEVAQLYSIDDQRFLPDRFVIGTCPHCGYERARGDQCEQCTTLLDAAELINPRSVISDSTNIELRTSKHLFLDLPQMQYRISAWIESKRKIWPKTSYSIAKKWLTEGLKARAITRDLKWGVPVPLDGYREKVFYVWFDAPIGYIGISMEWAKQKGDPDRWKWYWKDPNTKLYQFIGKDNVPFHTVTWPATMMGADDGFVLAHIVKGLEFLNFEGDKFSTSLHRGVFTDDALKEFPPDYWRYYLMVIAPERHDTDFQWTGFQQAINRDLSDSLGNFVHRTLTFINTHFTGKVPEYGPFEPPDTAILNKLDQIRQDVKTLLNEVEFQKAIKTIRDFWADCNAYFQEKAPWKAIKENVTSAKTTLNISYTLCRALAILGAPFIPGTAVKIYEYLGLEQDIHSERWDSISAQGVFVGTQIHPNPKPLFQKIDSDQIEALQRRYGGKEAPEIIAKKEEKIMPLITYNDFMKVELRVGKILEAEKVIGTKKLIRLVVDLGKKEPRQIMTGLADQYDPSSLVQKMVIVVANLQPRKIHGLESHGMLLAIEHADKPDKYIVVMTEGVPPGSRVL